MVTSNMTKKGLTTVEKAFEIIEILLQFERAGVSELAEEFDMPESTVHGYLATLVDQGYLAKEDDKYMVSVRFLDIGERARANRDIHEVAQQHMEELSESTGENSHLVIEENGQGVMIQKIRNSIDLGLHEGIRVPLHATAAGKVLLANMPAEKRERLLDELHFEPCTDETITEYEQMEAELEKVRERGVGFNREEFASGVNAVGAPIFVDGNVMAGITVTGPSNRMQGDRFEEELPRKLLEVANIIEISLSSPFN